MRHMTPFVRRNYQLRKNLGNRILFLTTTGRRSGLPRMTPLQYEIINGNIYLGFARGIQADWVRNIQADPNVEVELKGEVFPAHAEVILNGKRITDFLGTRLERHPFMIRGMLLIHGLPPWSGWDRLAKLGEDLALVMIRLIDQ